MIKDIFFVTTGMANIIKSSFAFVRYFFANVISGRTIRLEGKQQAEYFPW